MTSVTAIGLHTVERDLPRIIQEASSDFQKGKCSIYQAPSSLVGWATAPLWIFTHTQVHTHTSLLGTHRSYLHMIIDRDKHTVKHTPPHFQVPSSQPPRHMYIHIVRLHGVWVTLEALHSIRICSSSITSAIDSFRSSTNFCISSAPRAQKCSTCFFSEPETGVTRVMPCG